MSVKECYKCKETKEFSLFKINYGRKKEGKTSYANICLACVSLDNKKWIQENRELSNKRTQIRRWERKLRAVEYKGGKCATCLGIFPAECFDFHYIDKETKHKDPGLMMSHSDESLFKELDKCALLCANCHRTEHFKNGY